jgi:hypothetical protein
MNNKNMKQKMEVKMDTGFEVVDLGDKMEEFREK